MAKHSNLDWTSRNIEKILNFQALPGRPHFAYLYRRFSTLKDALEEWGRDKADYDGEVSSESLTEALQSFIDAMYDLNMEILATVGASPDARLQEIRNAGEVTRGDVEVLNATTFKLVDAGKIRLKDFDFEGSQAANALRAAMDRFMRIGSRLTAPLRREVATRIIGALGDPPNYEACCEAIEAWSAEVHMTAKQGDPRFEMVDELSSDIFPMISVYQDPARFFRDDLPDVWPYEIDCLKRDAPEAEKREALARCVWRWGMGVVLHNPTIRSAFEKVSPAVQTEILAKADLRGSFLDKGRPKSTDWTALRREYRSQPRGKRQRRNWLEAKAKELGIEVSSLERKVRPSVAGEP